MEVSLSALCERDLDFALLDLLIGWPEFGVWLAGRIEGLGGEGRFQCVAHSVMEAATGESDLELTWRDHDQGTTLLLVENKINAPFQPRQALRYHERGKRYVERGVCNSYRTLLVAPRSIIDSDPCQHGFDGALAYEEVLDWLALQPACQGLSFKKALLAEAIDRKRRGYQPVTDDTVTAFWRDCARLVQLLYPQLGLQYAGGDRPAKADTLVFRPDGFPRGFALWLRALPGNQGYIQLLIAGAAQSLERLAGLLGELPSPDHQIVAAGKSAAVRSSIQPIDMRLPLADQADQVVAALAQLERLREWTMERMQSNPHRLDVSAMLLPGLSWSRHAS